MIFYEESVESLEPEFFFLVLCTLTASCMFCCPSLEGKSKSTWYDLEDHEFHLDPHNKGGHSPFRKRSKSDSHKQRKLKKPGRPFL